MSRSKVLLVGSVVLVLPFIGMLAAYIFWEKVIFDNPDFWYGYMAYFGTVSLAIVSWLQSIKTEEISKNFMKQQLRQKIGYFGLKENVKNVKDLCYIYQPLQVGQYCNADGTDDHSKDKILVEVTLGKLSKEYNLDIEVLREQLKSLKPMDELAKEIFQKPVKIPEKRTNFDKFCEKVLYYMMNDLKYIKIYQYQLGFFENKVYRTIANEIVYYAGKHGNINVADFISYIEANEEVSADAIRIASTEEDLSEESLQGYIKAINKKTKEDQINKLRIELKQELDKAKKLDIAKRITEIKKGSV